MTQDFSYKWGEDVREAILASWHYLYPVKESRDSMEFIIWAFDMVQKNDEGAMVVLVDEVIAANPQMVEKAKKNRKLEGWFAGQILKNDNTLNPRKLAEVITSRFNEISA